MVRVNYVVRNNITFNSFLYVARIASLYIYGTIYSFPIYGSRNVVIGDLVTDMDLMGDIYWMDTPLVPKNPSRYRGKKIYVTSEYNREALKKTGVDIDGVIGRLIHPIYLSIEIPGYRDKDIDFIIIGYRDQVDRKNLDITCKLVKQLEKQIGIKYIAITNDRCFDNRYEFGSLSEIDKSKLITRSKFMLHLARNGGFEMPVWEAMCIGTIPIILDIPVFSEIRIDKIPVRERKIINTVYGDMEVFEADYSDIYRYVYDYIIIWESQYEYYQREIRDFCRNRMARNLKMLIDVIYGG